MIAETDLISQDIGAYLKQHENKELLRFITCGSVDDGKSTLIGRLLHDSKLIFEDQLKIIENESKTIGSAGDKLDLALLVDGLQSEREQGITIDVAYRYFATDKRKFIIADTPGHEQYTRNMATGASSAELAIILIDARHGVQTQTKRHSFITSLLGIKNIIIAINKMDLVDFSFERFEEIKKQYLEFVKDLKISNPDFIPICALDGDNVVTKSDKTPWYSGETLIEKLENVDLRREISSNFRFPVQLVIRPDLAYRGFAGTVASGEISVGDAITVLPSRKTSRIKSIVTHDGELQRAFERQAVTLTLEDEIDVSRGNLIVKSSDIPDVASEFDVQIVWMDDTLLRLGTRYLIKRATKLTNGSFEKIHYKQDVNTLEKVETSSLSLNEIGFAKLSLEENLAYDAYEKNRQTGSFIIIDKITNATIGAGMIVAKSNEEAEKKSTRVYTQIDIELNEFIRKNYPEWETKPIN